MIIKSKMLFLQQLLLLILLQNNIKRENIIYLILISIFNFTKILASNYKNEYFNIKI